jgi:hypothetical protein
MRCYTKTDAHSSIYGSSQRYPIFLIRVPADEMSLLSCVPHSSCVSFNLYTDDICISNNCLRRNNVYFFDFVYPLRCVRLPQVEDHRLMKQEAFGSRWGHSQVVGSLSGCEVTLRLWGHSQAVGSLSGCSDERRRG